MMRRSARLLAYVALACFIIGMPFAVGGVEDDASPIFGVKLPPRYRDWHMISVAREAGSLDDIRAVLGNDIAVQAFRTGTRPFPDGTIIARVAWKLVASEENNAIFGQQQSFVPGAPTNVQFSVKDGNRYAETGGWGYGQFEAGKPNHSEALMKTCAPCHAKLPPQADLVFTHLAP